MNPQEHKPKKNKNFKKKTDFDPIIKKVKFDKPKKREKEIKDVEFEDFPDEEVQKEEEKLDFDKFRDLFQEKSSKTQAKLARKEKEILNKINLKAPQAQEYPFIEAKELGEDPLEVHYGYNPETLIKEKVDLISEKAPQNAGKDVIQTDFAYAFEEQDDLEVLNVEQGTVTNNIKMKEFQLKSSCKGAGKAYQDRLGNVWGTDLRAEKHADGENKLSQPVVHSAFAINAEMEENEEGDQLKTVFPIMESFYDLVFTDPNEEGCMKVMSL